MTQPLEIERRFFIRRPEEAWLRAQCSHVYQMEQIYLLAEPNQTERVRRREETSPEYFHTIKIRQSDRTCIEQEEQITPEQYAAYLQRRDTVAQPICKTRYCLPEGEFVFEIDFYPFWPSYAVMEIELPQEDTPFRFPRGIEVLRELTGDHRFSNAALARHIPDESELL